MSRATGSRRFAALVPVGAVATMIVAFLWTSGVIPRIPVASEVVGLLAVLVAPGIAVEPALHGNRWTLVERLGLAAALSLALAALVGLGLHLTGLPVSPSNVLGILLVLVAPIGAVSIRFRVRRRVRPVPRRMRLDIIAGAGSLVLLTAGFTSILVLRVTPEQPPLEVMAVDGAGRLVTMPIRSSEGGTTLTIAVRSLSGVVKSSSITVDGDWIRPWSISGVVTGSGWTVVKVPVEMTRTGTLLAHVTVRGDGTTLTLPVPLEVAP